MTLITLFGYGCMLARQFKTRYIMIEFKQSSKTSSGMTLGTRFLQGIWVKLLLVNSIVTVAAIVGIFALIKIVEMGNFRWFSRQLFTRSNVTLDTLVLDFLVFSRQFKRSNTMIETWLLDEVYSCMTLSAGEI